MTLYDEIIDESEQLAENHILNDPTDGQIVDAISDIVGIRLGYNSVGAHLAIAAYNRMEQGVTQMSGYERLLAS